MKLENLNPFHRKEEKLETYLIAADNPVGKKQLRPIFRRKRSGEVLTREQVSAIKRGRKILRREMKEQGLKRRIDFELTATNMGLYFDKKGLLWPFFLWLIKDNTVLKVLATTAVLTTAVTVSVPVVQQVIEYLTEYIDKIVEQRVTEYQEKEVDRFTISLSDDMFNSGFTLSEDFTFENATSQLVAMSVEGVPCISIRDIPLDVNEGEGQYPDNSFFAYTFYCRYESTEPDPINYYWTINITNQTEIPMVDPETGEETIRLVSDAIWVMVFEDNEMLFYAKPGEDGKIEVLPEREYDPETGEEIKPKLAYEGAPMIDFSKNPESQYEIIQDGEYFDYYRIAPQNYLTDTVVANGMMLGVEPFDISKHDPTVPYDPENPNGIHKYTVVIWLEGDDPECTNELIGGKIGLNFRIHLEEDMPDGVYPDDDEEAEEIPDDTPGMEELPEDTPGGEGIPEE
ncbi:MAG: hypothetical protein IJ306_01305 [Oscillospiraceae bacterium]|nr:hypothetical protein [Oscillospiraceae bacterium]